MAEVIQVDKQPDLFATELFLIQSQGMERMVAQTMADEFRSFCNFRFFLPLDFLAFVADKLGLGITPDGFQRGILTWRIDALLRDINDQVYQPLSYYLTGENAALKRFQLARRLANIFDQYQVMRSGMLAGWEKGKVSTDHPAERWQIDLWRRLLKQPGGEVHRGMLFSRVTEKLSEEEELSAFLPKRVSVVGLHIMPPIFLDYLNSLARHMDVHLFLLSPCRNYWGNVESRRSQFRQLVRKSSALPVAMPEEYHPLLAVLGRQGRDLQNMMLEGASFTLEFSSYQDPLEGKEYSQATLLKRVQTDLLNGSLPEMLPESLPVVDDSIQLVACHSKLREVSILKDHLLRLLHQDPDLELRDVVVMAPDIQEYAPLIPAVFKDIQHSIADRSIRRRNSVIAAFLNFLDLFSGRFGWSELLDLLRQPMVYPQFQLSVSDLDTLGEWVTGAGIRWGLSGQQRKDGGLPDFEETSWRAGLDRLLMGYSVDSEDFVDGLLPYSEIEGRAAIPLGGLCQFIEVIDRARLDFLQSRAVGDWSITLLNYVEQLFGDSYQEELVELRSVVSELDDSIKQFHSEEVGFGVIGEWLNQSAKESRSSTGFLRGQLTFCSMLPMRSIPFRVVCLIGLNEGIFPKRDILDTFNLMGVDVRPGDRSPRADDRYQFLEAILAARWHLYLSYIGQSIRTNDEILPSVVVTEFVEVLEAAYGVTNLLVRHPLHPFSRRYFQDHGDSGLFSYDGYNCKIAETFSRERVVSETWWQGRLKEEVETVRLSDLLRFYTNPQKFFIKNCLGIRLDAGEEQPEEREMFEPDGLDKYHLEQQMLRAAMGGELDKCHRIFQAEGRWPLGNSGKLAFEEQRLGVEAFIKQLEKQEMGERIADLPVDLSLGGYRLLGTLSNLHQNGVMLLRYGKLRGRDLLSGWIHHLLLDLLAPPATTKIVAMDTIVGFEGAANSPDLGQFINLFIEGCLAPCPLYIEPAFAYARQLANNRSRSQPIDKALQVFTTYLEKGYEPEWELLLRGSGVENVPGALFERLCLEVMCSILGAANEQ